jgi:ADP-ribosyl-[dinitrogen reductase] hydrolase
VWGVARRVLDRYGFEGDVAERFVAWYERGPFDVGRMTARALSRLAKGDEWDEAGTRVWEASPEGQNAGNGSAMRCTTRSTRRARRRRS